MQRNEHATATKHDKKNGRDARKMLNKRVALSHGQFIHYEVPTRNGLQSSPATSNAIRGAEQSGNIANQRFARTMVG